MQTFATVLNIFLAGRFFAGLAVGLLCMVVPLLNSELAPRAWRGTLISFNQIAMTSGILVAFWVNYALQNFHNGWRYALGGQCVPAALLEMSRAVGYGYGQTSKIISYHHQGTAQDYFAYAHKVPAVLMELGPTYGIDVDYAPQQLLDQERPFRIFTRWLSARVAHGK